MLIYIYIYIYIRICKYIYIYINIYIYDRNECLSDCGIELFDSSVFCFYVFHIIITFYFDGDSKV